MNLVDLLAKKDIDPQRVLMLRHTPRQPQLLKALPWLAAEKPAVYNAYQQSQGPRVERAMTDATHVASFIGHEPGSAVFVGLFSNDGTKRITRKQYWRIPANVGLRSFGVDYARPSCLWFKLVVTDFYTEWIGKLIVRWPPPEVAWCRWAHKPKNTMPVTSILDRSLLQPAMPDWRDIDLSWEELSVLPSQWKASLREWRGIYYIFDTSNRRGYVGSAYGETNLLGRWLNYAARGHGGNKLLRNRDPRNFRFTILQRENPDMEPADVIRLEATWKERLHTRHPFGLNDN